MRWTKVGFKNLFFTRGRDQTVESSIWSLKRKDQQGNVYQICKKTICQTVKRGCTSIIRLSGHTRIFCLSISLQLYFLTDALYKNKWRTGCAVKMNLSDDYTLMQVSKAILSVCYAMLHCLTKNNKWPLSDLELLQLVRSSFSNTVCQRMWSADYLHILINLIIPSVKGFAQWSYSPIIRRFLFVNKSFDFIKTRRSNKILQCDLFFFWSGSFYLKPWQCKNAVLRHIAWSILFVPHSMYQLSICKCKDYK